MKYPVNVLKLQPTVRFNPADVDHMRAYVEILAGRRSPIRFELLFPHGNVQAMMERAIAMHYAKGIGLQPVDICSQSYGERMGSELQPQFPTEVELQERLRCSA